MCGRYSLSTDPQQISAQFDNVRVEDNIPANYNMAPTQHSVVITDEHPELLQFYKWGLIPYWAKDEKIGSRMINARSEGIEDKPSFRAPVRRRRCLVIADSFYEWKKQGNRKMPYRILLDSDQLMVMAGIWEVWSKGVSPVRSFSIITTSPNKEMEPIHNRMPVIFPYSDQWTTWLDEELPLPEVLEMLKTPDDDILTYYEIGKEVGSVRNNGPELHLPVNENRDKTLFD